MTYQLRKLERSLVVERTELGLGNLVDELVSAWEQAVRKGHALPDPVEFVRGLMNAGCYSPTGSRAIGYLEDCKRKNALPDRRRLLSKLFSG
jgi:hypothetical protein